MFIKLLDVKLLMSNFSAEIFLSTILQLWLNENHLSPIFSGINNKFSFFGFATFSFFCGCFYNFKRKIYLFLNIFSIELILFQVKAPYYHSVLWLPNQFRKHVRFKQKPLRRGNIQYSWEWGRTLYGGLGILWGDLITP